MRSLWNSLRTECLLSKRLRSENSKNKSGCVRSRPSRNDSTQNTARLLLPAINEMIDVTTARTIAMYTQLPRF